MTAGLSGGDRVLIDGVRAIDGALSRLDGMLARVEDWPPEALSALMDRRLAPDMFSFAQQVRTAVHFALRIALPLAGQSVPEPPAVEPGIADLRARVAGARALLDLPDSAFASACERRLRERAGFADLDLSAQDLMMRFGLPNFWFHLTTAYALLRVAGAPVGKADIDGLHDYPPGFSF